MSPLASALCQQGRPLNLKPLPSLGDWTPLHLCSCAPLLLLPLPQCTPAKGLRARRAGLTCWVWAGLGPGLCRLWSLQNKAMLFLWQQGPLWGWGWGGGPDDSCWLWLLWSLLAWTGSPVGPRLHNPDWHSGQRLGRATWSQQSSRKFA